MPIYEYQCTKCGNKLEIIQKFDDESLKICEKCLGELIKIISPAGFVLKGSGFYVNDYPSESRKKGLDEENGNNLQASTITTETKEKKETSS